MSRSTSTGRLCVILTLALLARVGAAVGVQRIVDRSPGQLCLISGDAEGYWELAKKIRRGDDYSLYEPPRRILRMPGFPIVLATTQSLFGEQHVLATRVVLALLATLACGLIWLLARIWVDENSALIATLGCAISPTFILFSVMILSETLFALTLTASLIAISWLWRGVFDSAACSISPPTQTTTSRSLFGRALVCGILVGIATYLRPTWIVVGPLVAASLFARELASCWRSKSGTSCRARRLLAGTGVLLGLVLAMAPWTYRNWQVCGRFVPTTLWMGASLYDGLHPRATGDSDMTFFDREQLGLTMSEYEVDQAYRRRAFDFLKANPGKALELALVKQSRYWSPVPNAAQFQKTEIQIPVLLFWLVLFVPAGIVAWQQRRNWRLLAITLGPLLYFAALHTLFVGSIRYRLPAEYVVWILAGMGWSQIGLRLAPTNTSPDIDQSSAEALKCT